MLRWAAVCTLLLLGACQTPTVTPTPPPATAPPAVTAARLDVLNQANMAFARGDLGLASGLYERVVNTPPAGEAAATTAAINQFAHFRDLISLLALGREDEARAQVDALQQADASAPLARLANQLWDQYGMIGEVRGACAQLQPDLVSQAGPIVSLLQSLGVNVDAASLCSVPAP